MGQLMEVVQTLRQRIDGHESELSQSEAQTRYSLIDPLLRALGWDTEDPKQVAVEYSVGVGKDHNGRADYMLKVGGKVKMVIEAKNLNELKSDSLSPSLFDNKPEKESRKSLKIFHQGTTYCQEHAVPYLVITDGRQWDLYETHKTGNKVDKLICWFDVKEGKLEAIVEKVEKLAEFTGKRAEEDHWVPLTSIEKNKKQKPIAIRFPDGKLSYRTEEWHYFLEEVVKYLIRENKLDTDRLPVEAEKGMVLVAKEPKDKNGTPWEEKESERDNTYTTFADDIHLYIRDSQKGGDRAFRHAITIIKKMELDPDKFAVRYAKH